MLQFQVSSEVEGMGRYGGERKAKPGHQERIPKPDLKVIRLEEKTGSPVPQSSHRVKNLLVQNHKCWTDGHIQGAYSQICEHLTQRRHCEV